MREAHVVAEGPEVIRREGVGLIISFPVAVMEHSDKSNLREKGFALATVLGYTHHSRETMIIRACTLL